MDEVSENVFFVSTSNTSGGSIAHDYTNSEGNKQNSTNTLSTAISHVEKKAKNTVSSRSRSGKYIHVTAKKSRFVSILPKPPSKVRFGKITVKAAQASGNITNPAGNTTKSCTGNATKSYTANPQATTFKANPVGPRGLLGSPNSKVDRVSMIKPKSNTSGIKRQAAAMDNSQKKRTKLGVGSVSVQPVKGINTRSKARTTLKRPPKTFDLLGAHAVPAFVIGRNNTTEKKISLPRTRVEERPRPPSQEPTETSPAVMDNSLQKRIKSVVGSVSIQPAEGKNTKSKPVTTLKNPSQSFDMLGARAVPAFVIGRNNTTEKRISLPRTRVEERTKPPSQETTETSPAKTTDTSLAEATKTSPADKTETSPADATEISQAETTKSSLVETTNTSLGETTETSHVKVSLQGKYPLLTEQIRGSDSMCIDSNTQKYMVLTTESKYATRLSVMETTPIPQNVQRKIADHTTRLSVMETTPIRQNVQRKTADQMVVKKMKPVAARKMKPVAARNKSTGPMTVRKLLEAKKTTPLKAKGTTASELVVRKVIPISVDVKNGNTIIRKKPSRKEDASENSNRKMIICHQCDAKFATFHEFKCHACQKRARSPKTAFENQMKELYDRHKQLQLSKTDAGEKEQAEEKQVCVIETTGSIPNRLHTKLDKTSDFIEANKVSSEKSAEGDTEIKPSDSDLLESLSKQRKEDSREYSERNEDPHKVESAKGYARDTDSGAKPRSFSPSCSAIHPCKVDVHKTHAPVATKHLSKTASTGIISPSLIDILKKHAPIAMSHLAKSDTILCTTSEQDTIPSQDAVIKSINKAQSTMQMIQSLRNNPPELQDSGKQGTTPADTSTLLDYKNVVVIAPETPDSDSDSDQVDKENALSSSLPSENLTSKDEADATEPVPTSIVRNKHVTSGGNNSIPSVSNAGASKYQNTNVPLQQCSPSETEVKTELEDECSLGKLCYQCGSYSTSSTPCCEYDEQLRASSPSSFSRTSETEVKSELEDAVSIAGANKYQNTNVPLQQCSPSETEVKTELEEDSSLEKLCYQCGSYSTSSSPCCENDEQSRASAPTSFSTSSSTCHKEEVELVKPSSPNCSLQKAREFFKARKFLLSSDSSIPKPSSKDTSCVPRPSSTETSCVPGPSSTETSSVPKPSSIETATPQPEYGKVIVIAPTGNQITDPMPSAASVCSERTSGVESYKETVGLYKTSGGKAYSWKIVESHRRCPFQQDLTGDVPVMQREIDPQLAKSLPVGQRVKFKYPPQQNMPKRDVLRRQNKLHALYEKGFRCQHCQVAFYELKDLNKHNIQFPTADCAKFQKNVCHVPLVKLPVEENQRYIIDEHESLLDSHGQLAVLQREQQILGSQVCKWSYRYRNGLVNAMTNTRYTKDSRDRYTGYSSEYLEGYLPIWPGSMETPGKRTYKTKCNKCLRYIKTPSVFWCHTNSCNVQKIYNARWQRFMCYETNESVSRRNSSTWLVAGDHT